MCIAFDGAYILEAPPADPASTDEYREPVPETLPSATSSIPSDSTALGKVSVPLSLVPR